MLKSFIGDKKFYKKVFVITLPILVQNVITNFVNLIDNVMVGRIGTEEMTGVAIVNQLIFVFNLLIFGALSGAGIFSAQFYGKGDNKGVRDTFRIKIILAVIISIISEIILIKFGSSLVQLFMHEGKESIDIEKTFEFARQYMKIMLIGLPAFAITQAYCDTLRSTDKTVLPMNASLIAVAVNMCFNYILIFGKFGAPVLGVRGAAIATVMARYVECAIVVIMTHINSKNNLFIKGAYRSLNVPASLLSVVAVKGIPLMLNEFLWSLGMTTIVQAYSLRGIEVISAQNISSTVSNLFNCVFFAFGSAVAIIIGQHLGSGNIDKAKDENKKLIFTCVFFCVVVGIVMALLSPYIPYIYNTEDSVRALATNFLFISAVFMPLHSFVHASYFTLRSGGKTIFTFIFDSGFMWFITIPMIFILSRYTNLSILLLYLCVQAIDIIKAILGFYMLKSGVWAKNLVDTKNI